MLGGLGVGVSTQQGPKIRTYSHHPLKQPREGYKKKLSAGKAGGLYVAGKKVWDGNGMEWDRCGAASTPGSCASARATWKVLGSCPRTGGLEEDNSHSFSNVPLLSIEIYDCPASGQKKSMEKN